MREITSGRSEPLRCTILPKYFALSATCIVDPPPTSTSDRSAPWSAPHAAPASRSPCIILSYTRLVPGGRPPLWRSAALLARCTRCPPPAALSKRGPAVCNVRCRSSPEFPFRFTWVLGWSTWYLCANDPTPCTCKTNYLLPMRLANRSSCPLGGNTTRLIAHNSACVFVCV
jgi:hypothetical protein